MAFWGIPILTVGLGKELFGFLTILWVFVGYFSLLDLGVSRAVTKFVADSIALKDREGANRLSWASVILSSLLGIMAAALLALSTQFWLQDVLRIPPALFDEARAAFLIAVVGIPFMLVFGVLKGIQMACQRFGLVNALQLLIGSSQWVGAVVLLWSGYGLKEIILLTVVARAGTALLSLLLTPRLLPGFFARVRFWDREAAWRLISYGGWVTVSQVVSPLFSYLDRILVGAFITLSAVAFYTVPQEALLRLLVVPMSLTATLFPALSQHSIVAGKKEASHQLYYRSVKYLFLLMVPLTTFLLVFAEDILMVWVGAEFAAESTTVFRILTVGMLLATLAQIPSTALQAFGRPDLPAKFHVVEFPVMLALNFVLIPTLGIMGAAITWSARLLLDAFLLFGSVYRHSTESTKKIRELIGWSAMRLQVGWAVLMIILLSAVEIVTVQLALAGVFLAVHVLLTWRIGLDETDKTFVSQLYRSVSRS
jgi:O-antigen/teichoic acid export membrane protein